MATGTVKWFNATKGFGFIQPGGGGKDVFVHISAVQRAGLTGLNEGQQIEYEIVSNRGREFGGKSEGAVIYFQGSGSRRLLRNTAKFRSPAFQPGFFLCSSPADRRGRATRTRAAGRLRAIAATWR